MDQLTSFDLDLRTGPDRLVERYRTVGLHLTWSPPTQRLFTCRPRPVKGEIVDLSVSGALLLAPTNDRVTPGSVATFECDGMTGKLEVRHVHATHDPALQYFGVLFLDLDQPLRQRIFDLIAQRRGGGVQLEQAWLRSR